MSRASQNARAGAEPISKLQEIKLSLLPEPESASRARRSFDDLDDQGVRIPGDLLYDIRLLTSELVTNAVRHAGLGPGEDIDLRVLVSLESVRVEVHDDGPGFDPPRANLPGPEQIGGRGLYLVQTLSDRWGVDPDDPTCVWFEVYRTGLAAVPDPHRS